MEKIGVRGKKKELVVKKRELVVKTCTTFFLIATCHVENINIAFNSFVSYRGWWTPFSSFFYPGGWGGGGGR